jgi:adenylyltransferase/sulfurtransferase
VLPGIIGSLQAMETIKLILGAGKPPLGKLMVYDALNSSFRNITLRRDPGCRLCGDTPTVTSVSNPETLAPAYCEIPDDDTMETITTAKLRQRLAAKFEGILLDVREPEEYALASIQGAQLIPLATLPDRVGELPKDKEILIHCKSGRRSARAVEFLQSQGFTNVKNVTGGIDAWLEEE